MSFKPPPYEEDIRNESLPYRQAFLAFLSVTKNIFKVGAACHGIGEFPFTVVTQETDGQVVLMKVPCI